MRILVTGHDGYIGTVLVPFLLDAGHSVTGFDSSFFITCGLPTPVSAVPCFVADIRDATPVDLAGFDAVVHLAGISNDPLGDLNPDCTYSINHEGTINVARAAKAAGVERFVFASSCSLYGASGDDLIDEDAAFNPVTPYGRSKVLAERDLSSLADDDFTPTFLRNATAYGVSPRLRGDLVVNNLTGLANSTGEVLMRSDGTPWRPLVHIEDISRAVLAVLEAPREIVHLQAFNVGRTDENYRVREVAEIVGSIVPDSRIVFAEGAGPDLRNYRVAFDKITSVLPSYQPQWTVERGVRQLLGAFTRHKVSAGALMSERFLRISQIRKLIEAGRLDGELRWIRTRKAARRAS